MGRKETSRRAGYSGEEEEMPIFDISQGNARSIEWKRWKLMAAGLSVFMAALSKLMTDLAIS